MIRVNHPDMTIGSTQFVIDRITALSVALEGMDDGRTMAIVPYGIFHLVHHVLSFAHRKDFVITEYDRCGLDGLLNSSEGIGRELVDGLSAGRVMFLTCGTQSAGNEVYRVWSAREGKEAS